MIWFSYQKTPIKLVVLLIFSLVSAVVNGQKFEVNMGLKTMHGVTANLMLQEKNEVRSGFGAVYYFPVATTVVYNDGFLGMIYLPHWANQNGVGINYFRRWESPWRWNKYRQFSIEYQFLKSGNYIDDYGSYSGNSDLDYAEFTQMYHNIALAYGFHTMLDHRKTTEFFIEFGTKIMFIERKYTIEGTYNEQTPSDKVEFFPSISPFVHVGLSMRLFKSRN